MFWWATCSDLTHRLLAARLYVELCDIFSVISRMPSVPILLANGGAFIAGLFLLEYGADKFVDHTAIVAKRLNVSPTLIGLLTCGAEWEEVRYSWRPSFGVVPGVADL